MITKAMRGALAFLLVWTASGKICAQTAATASWALTTNQTVVTSGSITAAAQQLSGLSIQDYISGGQRTIPPGNNWVAQTAADSTRFMQFVMSPLSGNDLNVNSVALMIAFYGSGTGRVNIAWSTDSIHFTNIISNFALAGQTTPVQHTFSGLNITVPSGKKMYLRISPWAVSNISNRYLLLKNLAITGTTNASPAAVWTLATNQSGTASGQLIANAQTLSGLEVNNYISGNGGQRILPQGGSWPANTGPDSNRYVQYAVTPVEGYNLVVNQVKVPLSFNSSAYAHARICWSTDGFTFTDLNPNLALKSGSVPDSNTFTNLNIPVEDNRTFYLRIYPWTTAALSNDRFLVSKDVSINGFSKVWPQLAFPTAEGAGRYARGGRGGDIYYVTNLKDSLAGSLRDAVSQPNRTIIFKVSGTINLRSVISITKDNITIAGQTAPGDGICLKNYGLAIRANNVIIRHIRSRPGDLIIVPGDSSKVVDAMYNGFGSPITQPFSNIIVDHCSMSWSTDEVGSFYAVSNFTLQWSMLSESLYLSLHTKSTPHGYGGIWGGQNASFHHNLLASNSNRNPRFSGSTTTLQPELEYADFRNNVVYNWVGSPYGGAGGHYNMINNYHKAGPATTGAETSSASNRKNRILLYSSYSTTLEGDTVFGGKFHVNGNYVHGYPDVTADNWTKGVQLDSYYNAAAMKAAGKALSPFPYSPVVTQTAEDAFNAVMNKAGAILPRRDTIDRRIIGETRTGTAHYGGSYSASGMGTPSGIIDSQAITGGWPYLVSTTYPIDTDNDGLPDWWEKMIQTSATDSIGVNRNIYAADGYTMLEKYLNGIPSPDQQVTFLEINAKKGGIDTVKVNFKIDWAKDQFKFGLFRSTDGSTFTKISEIPTSINATAYLMKDNAAPDQSLYYKIGSERLDGTGDIVYSNTVTIDNNALLRTSSSNVVALKPELDGSKGKIRLKLYPNPVSAVLSVKHLKAKPSAAINIYSITGEKVSTKVIQIGVEETEIDVSRLPQGSYIIELNNIDSRQNGIFVKI